MNRKQKKRLWIWGSLAIAVVALVIVAAVRWDAWFGQGEEEAYSAPRVPERILLTFGDSSELSRNVSWMCDTTVRDSFLELRQEGDSARRIEAEGEVFRSRSGVAAYYHAKLRGLRPDTRYAYRVVSGSDTSSWYEFRTRNPKADSFSFLYVGDVQDTVGGKSPEIFRHIAARYPDTEFLVCGGDFADQPGDKQWGVALGSLDSVCRSIPFMNVTGNHDYLKGLIPKLERRFSLVFSYFLDSMEGENQVYRLRYGDAEFFLLDSNRLLPGLLTQRAWLEKALESSAAKWKIVVVHHPLYSLKHSNGNLDVRWAFDGLIRDAGVDLLLQGHEHNYARRTEKRTDGSMTTPVSIVTHCSPKNYRTEFDEERFDKFGIGQRYYHRIEVTPDRLVLASYEVDSDRLIDSLVIVKRGGEMPVVSDYGRDLKEYMHYEPDPANKRDVAFKKRIDEYCRRHPDRVIR